MRKIKDLTNQIFGRWTVIKFSHCDKGSRWLCKCQCGTEKIVSQSTLKQGTSVSCGCYNRERSSEVHKLPIEIVAINSLYNAYKLKAKRTDRNFLLTKEEFRKLCSKSCHYCGLKPSNEHRPYSQERMFLYSGIDRVDNNIGYILENCVSSCRFCNQAKHTNSYEDFMNWLDRIKNYRKVPK